MPNLLEMVQRAPRQADFKIFTGALTAALDGDRKVIDCTASSSIVDLHGDEITAECVADMAQQALRKGMTIFLNHSYEVPEDTFGQTVAANSILQADGVAELHLKIEVDETNPRATQTYASIMGDPGKGRKGLRLGVSIGAQITDWEWRDEKAQWAGGIKIKGVELLEASIVGIPANQRSWVQNAVKSLRRNADLTLNASNPAPAYTISTWPPDTSASLSFDIKDAVDDDDDLEDEDDTYKESPGTGVEMEAIEAPADGTMTELAAEDASEEFLASHPEITAEPIAAEDVTASDLSVDEIEARLDAGSDSDPVTSAPDAGDSRGDADEPVTDQQVADAVASAADISISDADRPVLTVVLATLDRAASELRDTRSAKASVEKERDEAIAERDVAQRNLAEAQQIIEVLARLPLGRKARFVEPIQSFRQKFSGIYDEDFLRLIDERQDS